MTFSSYEQLKKGVILFVSNQSNYTEILTKVKDIFREEIASKRRFEKICSIKELLDILELRNELHEDNVRPLKSVILLLNNNDTILQEILQYELNHNQADHQINYYDIENIQSAQKINNSFTFCNSPVELMSPRKKQMICNRLTEELGSFWRDVARHLGIRECDIEDIDEKHSKTSLKVQDLLKLYELRTDHQRWFFDLCDALDNARRRDLTKQLRKIMTMNL